jgi:hypothetical protein
MIGAGLMWYFYAGGGRQRADVTAQHIADSAAHYRSSDDPMGDVLADIRGALPSWDLDAIKAELASTGRVVRRKAEVLKHSLSDATITARVKARLARDPDLSAWNISVNTTDGVVTLSGKVSSAEQIVKAMQLTMATEGVVEAISSLQIKPAPTAVPAADGLKPATASSSPGS